jgi:uncharacterized protein (DUF2249 family)
MTDDDQSPILMLDVRPLIEQGQDPLDEILKALDRLTPDGSLWLTSPFRPDPLIQRLEARGYRLQAIELGPDHWQTEIRASTAAKTADSRSPDPAMQGLSLDQAPPLEIPAGFFLTAPFAIIGAGILLLWTGADAFQSNWLPLMLGLTHLGTLGFLTMVMMGALYQMIPVIAGARVPFIRLAHIVHLLMCVAIPGLVLSLLRPADGFTFGFFSLAALAALLFCFTTGFAVSKTRTRGETVAGMRLALFSLLVMMLLGLAMARGFFDGGFPGARGLWVQVHLGTALLGWVGGLITAVSWQVVPMFYLTPSIAPIKKKIILMLTLLGILLPLAVLMIEQTDSVRIFGWDPARTAALGALPALLAIWFIHPCLILFNLRNRRRKRVDASLYFWQTGLCFAPVTAIAAVIAHFAHDPRWGMLFGWLAIWGWAGMIAHGMLSRILPFLIWFHRFAPHIGQIPVPAMRKMLPDYLTRLGLGFHIASVLLGVLAIVTRDIWIARITGLCLLATGINLLHWMTHLLRQRPDRAAFNKQHA